MFSTPRILAVIGLVSLGFTLGLRGDDPAKKPAAAQTPAANDHDGWMELKLISSKQVFEGLTHGEYKQVENAARRMLVLNLLEQWVNKKDFTRKSEYRGQLNAFEYSVKELVRHAEDHDSEGALEAYVEMTRSCVRCHELIRDSSGVAAK